MWDWDVRPCGRAAAGYGFVLTCVPGAPVAFGHAAGLLPDTGSCVPMQLSTRSQICQLLLVASERWWR